MINAVRTMKPTTPILAFALLAGSGCVSAKYKPAAKETPPPVALNLTSAATRAVSPSQQVGDSNPTEETPSAEVTVHSVIVFRGPGSWKRDAYWDEYVVTVANRGELPLTIQTASLVGLAQVPATPGREPWALERTSRTAESQGYGLGKDKMIQIGAGSAVVLAAAVAGAATTLAGGVGVVSAGAAAAAGAALASIVAVPAFVGGTIYRNVSNRHDIEREFQRRQFVMPAVVAAHQTAKGSLFFPITPGPRRLDLKCVFVGERQDLSVDLTPLAGLHLKPTRTAPEPIKSE